MISRSLAIGWIVLLASFGRAETPAEAVLRRLPPESGLVVMIPGFREHSAVVMNSPLAQWASGPLNQKLEDSTEWKSLQQLQQLVLAPLGVSITDLR
ncbi:MAG: hypothetical protein ACRCZF_12780, partial [Gemmataceae bacterium]